MNLCQADLKSPSGDSYLSREGGVVIIPMLEKIKRIAQAAEDKKAENIVALDFRSLDGTIFDAFLICSGTSERHVQAICEHIRIEMKKINIYPTHVEGALLNHWVLMDYGDVIVHIFLDQLRNIYRLESLWHNAVPISLRDLSDQ